jgi:integrase
VAINKRGDRYVLDWWADGRRFRKFFDTQTDAKHYRTEIDNHKLRGDYVTPGKVPLFKQEAEAWLKSRADRTAGTYDQYRGHVTRHLLPRFGELRLDRISHEIIEAWRTELARKGGTSRWRKPLSASTVGDIMGTLSRIFNFAVRGKRLASNPCKMLEPVYNPAREGEREDDEAVRPEEILNPEEIKRLLLAAEPGLFRTLFTLAAATGAREGELLGLKWTDITFDGRPQIAIRRSLSWAKGPDGSKSEPRFNPPKTKAGVRDIPIDAPVALALKHWRLQAGRNEHDLVFAQPDGKPMRRSVLLETAFWPTLKRGGLRHVRFHSLRHSFASGLIGAGAVVTEVQHLLGHSKPSMTLDVYSHWFKGKDSGAASVYSATLFGETGSS